MRWYSTERHAGRSLRAYRIPAPFSIYNLVFLQGKTTGVEKYPLPGRGMSEPARTGGGTRAIILVLPRLPALFRTVVHAIPPPGFTAFTRPPPREGVFNAVVFDGTARRPFPTGLFVPARRGGVSPPAFGIMHYVFTPSPSAQRADTSPKGRGCGGRW